MKEIPSGSEFIRFIEANFGAEIWGKLQGCSISSVVPAKNKMIVDALSKYNLPIQYVDITKGNIDFSKYKSRLGEDRIVCCQAAVAKHGTQTIVVDLGTATTINIVNKDSIFEGGVILTGLETGLKALTKNTAQLPLVDNLKNVKLIGTDTTEGLVSGAIMGTVCMIEGFINRIKHETNSDYTVILTGGNANKIMQYSNFKFIHEPSLLLEGLFMACE